MPLDSYIITVIFIIARAVKDISKIPNRIKRNRINQWPNTFGPRATHRTLTTQKLA